MKKSRIFSKWLLIPAMAVLIIAALILRITNAFFFDVETSNTSSVTAWTSANWTQTLQSDFAAGILNGVNIIDSPGDAKLASSSAILTNSPATSTGTWTNPTNAYADGGSYSDIVSGSPSGNETYGGYGFSFGTSAIYGVRVRTDAWTLGTSGLTNSKNPASNTNGTLAWTNPANSYTSNDAYATFSPTYGTATSKNPAANTNGTLAWTNPANGYTSNSAYATVAPTYGSTTSKNPTANTNGTYPLTNPDNAYNSDNQYATAAYGPTVTTKAPSVIPGSVWTNPTYAYAQDTNYATSSTNGQAQIYRGYGFSISGTVSSVRVNIRAYSDGNKHYDSIRLELSNNGGSSWLATSTTVALNGTMSDNWQNVTTWTNWTPSSINNNQIQAKVTEVKGASQSTVYLDYIPIEVTTTNINSFDQLYGAFGITDPAPTSTITKVEIGYEAFATATGKLDIYTSDDGGSGWHTVHTTANLGTTDPNIYTYIDVTGDSSWTWTLLNDSNFKAKVVTNRVSGNPTWSLDALVVRVTYDDRQVRDQIYGTFAVTDPGTSSTITKVEVGYEAFASATGKLDIYTSNSNGSSWSPAHTTSDLGTSDPGSYTYVDVTSDFGWTWANLADPNFKVKISTNFTSGAPAWSLDALVVRVTCDDRRNGDQIYGTFGITGTAETIAKVEVGYEAFATATGRLDIYTSNNGGSSWSSVHTTADLATSDNDSASYVDVTPDFAWTWSTLNDSNLKVKVVTNRVSGSPVWSLDALTVRVTYKGLDNEQIRYRVTWDGGSTWSNYATSATTDTKASYWYDFTSATSWTGSKLSDTNFKVSVEAVTVGDTGDVRLDWIPVEVTYQQYSASGTLASQVLDTAVNASGWDGLAWDRTLPASTNITFEVRASNTAFLSGDSTPAWTAIGGTSPVISNLPAGRYKQWRATLTPNGNRTSTPSLNEVRTYYYGG